MSTKNQRENLPTAQRLDVALSAVAEPLRDELYAAYHLMNPIQLAGFLLSLELPNDVTRELLLTKVSQPPAYKGPAIEILMQRAVEDFWQRIGEANVATA